MARPLEQVQPLVYRLGPPPGEARREVLCLHDAWHGAWSWQPLARQMASQGFGVHLLELPGHGKQPWELPAFTRAVDYAHLAARTAAAIRRPVLVGHGLGAWLILHILQQVDLPAVLLAPLGRSGLPAGARMRLVGACPGAVGGLLLGRPLAVDRGEWVRRLFCAGLDQAQADEYAQYLAPEPWGLGWELLWGLPRVHPTGGQHPRLVVAGGRDFFLDLHQAKTLARSLEAEFAPLPSHHHALWLQDPAQRVADLLLDFLTHLEF